MDIKIDKDKIVETTKKAEELAEENKERLAEYANKAKEVINKKKEQ